MNQLTKSTVQVLLQPSSIQSKVNEKQTNVNRRSISSVEWGTISFVCNSTVIFALTLSSGKKKKRWGLRNVAGWQRPIVTLDDFHSLRTRLPFNGRHLRWWKATFPLVPFSSYVDHHQWMTAFSWDSIDTFHDRIHSGHFLLNCLLRFCLFCSFFSIPPSDCSR